MNKFKFICFFLLISFYFFLDFVVLGAFFNVAAGFFCAF